MPPNFYYEQEDFLRSQQVGKSWRWTALRPEAREIPTKYGLLDTPYEQLVS